MIVDCYTHTWHSADQLGRCLPPEADGLDGPPGGLDGNTAGPSRHYAAAEPVATTFVLGFKSQYLGADIPNDQVAAYVGQHPDRLIGFAGIDPSEPRAALAEIRRCHHDLSMKGIAVAPAAQDYHPTNSQAMLIYAEAERLGMPILFHSGVFLSASAKLEYAHPVLLDEVARELPNLKIILAHMGHPWVAETLVLLAKHTNVYAELSRLLHQPWQAYQALLAAHQYGVTHKLLFGSGFPSAAASPCIEALYSVNHLVSGTNLPTIPRERLRGIVERDALGLLGLGTSIARAS